MALLKFFVGFIAIGVLSLRCAVLRWNDRISLHLDEVFLTCHRKFYVIRDVPVTAQFSGENEMPAIFRCLICLLFTVLTVSGCYNTPVRHLASDAALIKIGESDRDSVLTFLGEPDEQVVIKEGVEKWVYREYEKSILKDAPVVGTYFGEPDYGTVTVIIRNNIVVDCVFGAWEYKGQAWAKDFDWQETE